MDWSEIIAWGLVLGLGLGWWLDHRGAAGIRRDYADAKREIDARLRR